MPKDTKFGSERKSAINDYALRPTSQITETSYIGNAFERLLGKRDDPDDSGDDSSEPSDSDSSSASGWGDSPHESDDTLTRKLHKKVQRKRAWLLKRRKDKRSALKPIPPDVYDGAPDTRLFHHFVTQAAAYLADGQVAKKRQALVLMNFLSGKAYEFYVQKVSYSPELWTLHKFFSELFNYCFPVNFRSETRKKFKKCHQGNRRVHEFVSELRELALIIGQLDEREKTVWLWFGCHKEIQKELYMQKVHPERSSLIKL
jgi:hypothetical protein